MTAPHNPYLSLEGPPEVDAETERIRIHTLVNCGEKPRHHPTGHRDQIQESVWLLDAIGAPLTEGFTGDGYHRGVGGLRDQQPTEGWVRQHGFPFSREVGRTGAVVTWLWGERSTPADHGPATYRYAVSVAFPDGLVVEYTTLNGQTPGEAYAHALVVEGWVRAGDQVAFTTGCRAYRLALPDRTVAP